MPRLIAYVEIGDSSPERSLNEKFGLSSVAVFAIWRSTQRTEIEIEEQGDFVVMATTSPLTASLNPDVDLPEIEAAADEEAEDIQSSFEELVNDLESVDPDTSTNESDKD